MFAASRGSEQAFLKVFHFESQETLSGNGGWCLNRGKGAVCLPIESEIEQ